MFSNKLSSGYNTAKVVTKKYWSFLNKLSLFATHLSWLAGTKFKNAKSDLVKKKCVGRVTGVKILFFGIYISII